MNKKIHQPSDSLFKKTMSDIRVANDFFNAHLPDAILEVIDLDLLQLESHSFIDERYQKSESDMIYSVKTKDNATAYFYLLCEQQSEMHHDMPFRLLKYQIRLMDQHRKQHPKAPLPIVYPMVVYSGKAPWTKPRSIFPYFGEQAALARSFLGENFQLIDLHRMEDHEMRQRILSGIVEYALKNKIIRNTHEFLKLLFPWLDQIEIEYSDDLGKIILQYVLRDADETDKQVFIEELERYSSSKIRSATMTLAEQFREEGREEGLQKGLDTGRTEVMSQVVANMLDKKLSIAMIIEITGLSADAIRELQETQVVE